MQKRTLLIYWLSLTTLNAPPVPTLFLPSPDNDTNSRLPQPDIAGFMEQLKVGANEVAQDILHKGVYYSGSLLCFITASGLVITAARRPDAGFNRKTGCLIGSAAACATLGTLLVTRPDLFGQEEQR